MILSIIIPCYNHGVYLLEALDSIRLNGEEFPNNIEIIVVNDGSTDPYTLEVLKKIESQDIVLINQPNSGLAEARNAGLKIAKGAYILPLDSDNKLIIDNVIMALSSLAEIDKNVDVLFSDAILFGEQSGQKHIENIDIYKLLQYNYIDACAIIKSDVLKKFGFYDGNMPAMGNEDWELWIRLLFNKCVFKKYHNPIFFYRVLNNSMSAKVTRPSYQRNLSYIYSKYAPQISSLFYPLSSDELNNYLWFKKYATANFFLRFKFSLLLLKSKLKI